MDPGQQNKIKIILLSMVIVLLASCTSWRQVSIHKQGIPDNEYYVVIHQGQDQWFMYDVSLGEDSINGKICNVIDKSLEAHFLHLYVASSMQIPDTVHIDYSISMDDIITVQVSEFDRKRTIGISYATFGAYVVSAGLIFLLFYLLL